jgi:hypothetical protein
VNRLAGWAAAAALLLGGCYVADQPAEEPLLLEEPTDAPAETTEDMADNSRCFVCHFFNYSDEPLAVTHAHAGIGCVDCHGDSEPHTNDENNVTPPDKMYPRDAINPACLACHTKKDLLEKPKEHKLILPQPKTAKSACTDCHGEHRLEDRVVRWDKKTGKLLPKEQQPE